MKRLIPVTTFYDGNRFITNQNGVWKATPLLLSVAVSEVSDIAFAVDSPSVAVVLGFFGCKMILMDYFGIIHVSTATSLGFVASSLTIGVLLSVLKNSKKLG
ncbi:hypothetical protein K1719_020719 [Acacia pycnantha]|nr:hypothetical protein K1719_033664 [Acacia pycnantha]KAI9108236.1 hypothetical protein K1719_020719 [Acacia pycnantha]